MYNKNTFLKVNTQIQVFVVDRLVHVLEQIAEWSLLNSKYLLNQFLLEQKYC